MNNHYTICKRSAAMVRNYLWVLLLLLNGFAAWAQPSGYTDGTEVCWTFNSRPHLYFRSAGWNPATDHSLVFFTDTSANCTSMLQQVVASLLDDAGTNWDGVTTLPDASTRKWQIITIGATSGNYLSHYAQDIKYFYEHIGTVDTGNHSLHHIGGITAGSSRVIGFLLNTQLDNSPYRFIFSTGIYLSPTWQSNYTIIPDLPTQRNMVWFGTADANGGSPPSAAQALYNTLPGTAGVRKWIESTVGGTHDNSTWGDCMKLTGTTNRWTWMILPPAGLQAPEANAGANKQVLLPASSVTLTGSGTDGDGTITSYAWAQVSGAGATITSPSSASTTVTGLSLGSYKFRLIVTDNDGLKDTAYALVSVTSHSHQLQLLTKRMIPITAWRNAENLVDGNLSTAPCNTYVGSGFAIPQEFIYILGDNDKDSTYDNLKVRLYNGDVGGPSFTMWLMADNFADSVAINDVPPYNNWKYIDSNFTRIAPWPVRYIKFRINGCAGPRSWGEIQIYGTAVAPATSFFVDQNFTQASPKFSSYFGANVNGDEPDSLWNAFHSVRLGSITWYYDTATIGITPSTHKFIFSAWGDNIPGWTTKKNQFGFNREMWFYTAGASAANITPVPKPSIPGNPNMYGYYSNQGKDIPKGSDSTNPANWINSGRLGYATAAIFGKNTSASLTGYDITAGSLNPGQDLLRGIEFGNESNRTWAGDTAYSSPRVKVAELSAAYDGHMGLLGPRIGVKKADTSFKVYAGALVSADSSYLKALCYWVTRYRGKGNVPFDVLNINAYCTDAGVQHSGTQGVSPEQFRAYEYWTKTLEIVHRMLGNVEVRWSEFGWDSNSGSIYSAKPHGSKDGQEVKADRIIHSYHIGRLARLHGADQYRSRDEHPQGSNAGFATSGQFGQIGSYTRWKTSYWMSTTLSVLNGYNAWPTLITKGDSTGIWVLRDDPVTDDTTVYTLFRGTNDGSTQSYTLNLDANATWAERVDMQDGNKTGLRTTLVVSGNSISLSNIGESPVYIRVRYGAQELLGQSVVINAYPNPSPGVVILNARPVARKNDSDALGKSAKQIAGHLKPVYIKQIKVYNTLGVLVKTLQYPGEANNVSVNLGNQAPGVYHFVVTTTRGIFNKKVEIQ